MSSYTSRCDMLQSHTKHPRLNCVCGGRRLSYGTRLPNTAHNITNSNTTTTTTSTSTNSSTSSTSSTSSNISPSSTSSIIVGGDIDPPSTPGSKTSREVYRRYAEHYSDRFRADIDYQYEEKPRQISCGLLLICPLAM
eukprot:GHVQ01005476.1.p1 GENE.GHVQ01005476.1~~GHVQ01005476.1.p1  ORF type:complete len:138 (-),score=14.55 GHVQ01005476.1:4-417(-)